MSGSAELTSIAAGGKILSRVGDMAVRDFG